MSDIKISNTLSIPESEVELTAIRASGPGGQHVNTSATAIQLRFDVANSSLPWRLKNKLLSISDSRLNANGEIVIKAQEHRSQVRNKQSAIDRLKALIQELNRPVKRRIPTRPSRAARKRRVDRKTRRGEKKRLRGKVDVSKHL